MDSYLLGGAIRIAERLARTAIWNGSACTWQVTVPDPADPWSRPPLQVRAEPTLYQGTAGIALFLCEVGAILGDATLARVGRGALVHAHAGGLQLSPDAIGFHSGRTGIAYVLARAAVLTKDSWYADAAERMTLSVRSQIATDSSLDVIGGCAGAIPPVLGVSAMLENEDLREIAFAMGEHLLNHARRLPSGLAWRGGDLHARELTGYAHGASGCAHAFAELYAISRDVLWRQAAELAIGYERDCMTVDGSGWLDYRNSTLARTARLGSLRSQAPEALLELSTYRPSSMAAWCHGAPGIALARLRISELWPCEQAERDARVAVEATRVVVASLTGNASLCHGILGNAEALLSAARVWRAPSYFAEAVTAATALVTRYAYQSGGQWPTGVLGAGADPSLMVGEAGIGFQLLRIAGAAVPSILAVVPPKASCSRPDEGDIGSPARRDSDSPKVTAWRSHALHAFPISLRRIAQLGERHRKDFAGVAVPMDGSPAETASALRQLILAVPPQLTSYVHDAVQVELSRFDLLKSFRDYTRTQLAHRLPITETRGSVAEVTWHLRVETVPIRLKYDWESWEVRRSRPLPPDATAAAAGVVLFAQQDDIVHRTLGLLAFTVINALTTPRRLAELVATVSEALHVQHSDAEELSRLVENQVWQAHASGLIYPVGTS